MAEPLLVTAREAADVLSVDLMTVYRLCSAGDLEKRYIGKGTRNFRIPYASLRAYAASLPRDPVEETA